MNINNKYAKKMLKHFKGRREKEKPLDNEIGGVKCVGEWIYKLWGIYNAGWDHCEHCFYYAFREREKKNFST